MTTKLFTKSAFKIALSCPWKLFYYRNPDVYANSNLEDDFLASLAKGGFQVGELAKVYCRVDPDADLKDLLGYKESLDRTKELMERENVTIAEAAFKFGNLFVRVDILEKHGHDIKLIEVKAKSWDLKSKIECRDGIVSDIREYVYDAAFQKYVVKNALGSDYSVKAFLMMADKDKVADVDGLNQLFKIRENSEGRTEAVPVPGFEKVLSKSQKQVLYAFDVDRECEDIIEGRSLEQAQNLPNARVENKYKKAMDAYRAKVEAAQAKGKACRAKMPIKATPEYIENDWMNGLLFKKFVDKASTAYCNNRQYNSNPTLCGTCFKCEFVKTDPADTKRDGKAECWQRVANYQKKPMVEVLNGANIKKGDWVRRGVYFLNQVTGNDLKENTGNVHTGLDYLERKWVQIGLETGNTEILEKFGDKIKGHTYLDIDGLKKEMKDWTPPLHMIDFETTAVALPYYKGMRPYEQVAFQFSHHVIKEDGSIEHYGQYLNEDVTKFPNFEFVRELKKQLSNDSGTIFRYATHENTILRDIARQLKESEETDKDELIRFIRNITHNDKPENGEVYKGDRDMVDLLEVVKKYFYNLDHMHGSNSIKQVLPAVLNCSAVLKEKYSKAIYGSEIKSCNYTPDNPKVWIEFNEDGTVESPYHRLESVGKLIGLSDEEIKVMEAKESSEEEDFEVANGGAALTAYNKLMFCDDTKMNDGLRKALLRYCELDTMSMVFIWEYFNTEIKKG